MVHQPGTRHQASQRDERGTRREDVQTMTAPIHLQESRALTAADSVRKVIEAMILENHRGDCDLTARTEEQQHAQRWPS